MTQRKNRLNRAFLAISQQARNVYPILRRWPSIKTSLAQRLMLLGVSQMTFESRPIILLIFEVWVSSYPVSDAIICTTKLSIESHSTCLYRYQI